MPSKSILTPPPPANDLDPKLTVWQAGTVIYRVHSMAFAPTEFNPGHGKGRFHPFQDISGRCVPVMYGSDCREGALSETVFRGVPVVGTMRGIRRNMLKPVLLSLLVAKRNLRMIDLRGNGLRRLGLQRNQLLETEADSYPLTAAWSKALHRCNCTIDGLIWISRQFDTASVMVLFGDRLSSNDLGVLMGSISLYKGSGFSYVQQIAEDAGIVIIE